MTLDFYSLVLDTMIRRPPSIPVQFYHASDMHTTSKDMSPLEEIRDKRIQSITLFHSQRWTDMSIGRQLKECLDCYKFIKDRL